MICLFPIQINSLEFDSVCFKQELHQAIGNNTEVSNVHVDGLFSWQGPFLASPGNLPGSISVFVDKCFLTEVNFC